MRHGLAARLALLVALLAPFALLGACAKKAEPKATTQRVVYTVRGLVVQLPQPGNPGAEFRVHHEAIPDFRASLPDGALGMRAMIMPFSPAPDLSLDALSVGDKIELKFEALYALDGGQITDSRVIAVRTLPPETPLNLDGG